MDRITSLFSTDDKEGIFSKLSDCLLSDRSSVTRSTVDNVLADRIKTLTTQKFEKERINIPYSVTPESQKIIVKDYPEYDIVFSNTQKVGHGAAAALRLLERRLLDQLINYDKAKIFIENFKAYDDYVTDAGGDSASNILSGKSYVHSCEPCLAPQDSVRSTTRTLKLLLAERKTQTVNDLLNKISTPDNSDLRCHNKVQSCKRKSLFIICHHSLYDMGLDALVDAMDNKNSLQAHCCLIFSPEIFYRNHGTIPGVDAVYTIKGNVISFSFVNDTSHGYVHDLTKYLNIFRNPLIKSRKGNQYAVELTNNRAGVQFIKVTRLVRSYSDYAPITGTIPHLTMLKTSIIKTYTWNYLSADETRINLLLTPVSYYLNTNLVQDILQYTLKLTDNRFQPSHVYDYATTASTRIIHNAQNVENYTFPDAVQLYNISYAIYLYAFKLKWEAGKVLKCLVDEQKRLREERVTWWKQLLMYVNSLWKSTDPDGHHADLRYAGGRSIHELTLCDEICQVEIASVVSTDVVISTRPLCIPCGTNFNLEYFAPQYDDAPVVDKLTTEIHNKILTIDVDDGPTMTTAPDRLRGGIVAPHYKQINCNLTSHNAIANKADGLCFYYSVLGNDDTSAATALMDDLLLADMSMLSHAGIVEAKRNLSERDQADCDILTIYAYHKQVELRVHRIERGECTCFSFGPTSGEVIHLKYTFDNVNGHYERINLNESLLKAIGLETSVAELPTVVTTKPSVDIVYPRVDQDRLKSLKQSARQFLPITDKQFNKLSVDDCEPKTFSHNTLLIYTTDHIAAMKETRRIYQLKSTVHAFRIDDTIYLYMSKAEITINFSFFEITQRLRPVVKNHVWYKLGNGVKLATPLRDHYEIDSNTKLTIIHKQTDISNYKQQYYFDPARNLPPNQKLPYSSQRLQNLSQLPSHAVLIVDATAGTKISPRNIISRLTNKTAAVYFVSEDNRSRIIKYLETDDNAMTAPINDLIIAHSQLQESLQTLDTNQFNNLKLKVHKPIAINRASEKLREILTTHTLYCHRFLDLCAAPGHMTKRILNHFPHSVGVMHYYDGIKAVSILPEITNSLNITIVKPNRDLDYCGDLRDSRQVDYLKSKLIGRFDLVVADGCYEDPDHADNQLVTDAEIDIALSVLTYSGQFLYKAYAKPYLTSQIDRLKKKFDHIEIIKPKASNPLSSEIYILCRGFSHITKGTLDIDSVTKSAAVFKSLSIPEIISPSAPPESDYQPSECASLAPSESFYQSSEITNSSLSSFALGELFLESELKFEELTGDLFKAPKDYCLAHCVSQDLAMFKGIAESFSKIFGNKSVLKAQGKVVGQAAKLPDKNRFIYYLITKKNFSDKPKLNDIRSALLDMKEHMDTQSLSKLAMPRIACGLDKMDWETVSNVIREVFQGNYQIRIYSPESKSKNFTPFTFLKQKISKSPTKPKTSNKISNINGLTALGTLMSDRQITIVNDMVQILTANPSDIDAVINIIEQLQDYCDEEFLEHYAETNTIRSLLPHLPTIKPKHEVMWSEPATDDTIRVKELKYMRSGELPNYDTTVMSNWNKSSSKSEYNPKFEVDDSTDLLLSCRNAVREILETWRATPLILEQEYSRIYGKYSLHSGNINLANKKRLTREKKNMGVLNLKTGQYVQKPISGKVDHTHAFNGIEFVTLSADRKGKPGLSDYALISDDMEIMNEYDLYVKCNALNYLQMQLPTIENIQGVPGCGKTTYVVRHAKAGDLILAATRDGAAGIKAAAPELSNNVFTMHSYLLHGKSASYDEVWVDEALKEHLGTLLLVVIKSRCKNLHLIGDAKQIPYFNRLASVVQFYSNVSHFLQCEKKLNISHRVPMDVAYLMSPYYEGGMTTTNPVEHSLSFKLITNYEAVPKSEPGKYLVFKKMEKQLLQAAGYKDVSTVGEYQGRQEDHIILIRTSNVEKDEIYDREEQIIVALTRHRKSLTYYTMRTDTITKMILSVPVDGSIVNIARMKGGRSLAGTSNPLLAIDQKMLTKKITTILDDPIASLITLNKGTTHVPIRPIVTYTVPYNLCPPQMFHPSHAGVEFLQNHYDYTLPGAGAVDYSYDQFLAEKRPFHFYHDNVTITLARLKPYPEKSYDCLRPALRTSIAHPRRPTQYDAMIGLAKRNLNIPNLDEVVEESYVTQLGYDLFIHTYIRDRSMLASFSDPTNQVYPSHGLVAEWLADQPESVKNLLNDPDIAENFRPNRYSLMNKKTIKPGLTMKSVYEYSAVQTIASQCKSLNALFCPIFRELKRRLLAILKSNFMIFSDVSPEEFAEELTKRLPPRLVRFLKILEIDIGKFDKSQYRLLFEIECLIYEALGLPKFFILLWRLAHEETILIDIANGVRCSVFYQRKSGDASTFFGNTLVLMIILATLFDLTYAYGLFAGDDSVLWLSEIHQRNDLCANLFNLESKFYQFKYSYFCSKFLVTDGEHWYLVPDPLKVLTKLGRHDLVNWEHAEEYRTSLKDLLKSYSNYHICELLSPAYSERYPKTSVTLLMGTIYHLVSSKNNFKELYYSNEGDILYTNQVRPSLDV